MPRPHVSGQPRVLAHGSGEPFRSCHGQIVRRHSPRALDDTDGEQPLLAGLSVAPFRRAHTGAGMLAVAAQPGTHLTQLGGQGTGSGSGMPSGLGRPSRLVAARMWATDANKTYCRKSSVCCQFPSESQLIILCSNSTRARTDVSVVADRARAEHDVLPASLGRSRIRPNEWSRERDRALRTVTWSLRTGADLAVRPLVPKAPCSPRGSPAMPACPPGCLLLLDVWLSFRKDWAALCNWC